MEIKERICKSFTRARMMKIATTATEAFRLAIDDGGRPGADDHDLSDVAIRAKKLIDSGVFGCQKESVRKLTEIILGEELGSADRGNSFIYTVPGMYAIVVPVGAYYDSAYRENAPVMIVDNSAMGMDSGGELPEDEGGLCCKTGTLRAATKKEIKEFIDELYG